jgi:hypothetical protein
MRASRIVHRLVETSDLRRHTPAIPCGCGGCTPIALTSHPISLPAPLDMLDMFSLVVPAPTSQSQRRCPLPHRRCSRRRCPSHPDRSRTAVLRHMCCLVPAVFRSWGQAPSARRTPQRSATSGASQDRGQILQREESVETAVPGRLADGTSFAACELR